MLKATIPQNQHKPTRRGIPAAEIPAKPKAKQIDTYPMDGRQQSIGDGRTKRSAEAAAIGAPDFHKRPRTANANDDNYGDANDNDNNNHTANGVSMNGSAGRAVSAVENGEVKAEEEDKASMGAAAQGDDEHEEGDGKLPANTSPSSAAATAADAPTSAPATAPAASASAAPSASGQSTSEPVRWRAHRMAEDYIGMASSLILPTIRLGPYGYDASSGLFPTERITALGLLTSPVRRPTVVERWNPYEICVFEASMALYGKDFHEVARTVGTKSCKEVVEFYYVWKKTEHYKVWKREYTPHLESDEED